MHSDFYDYAGIPERPRARGGLGRYFPDAGIRETRKLKREKKRPHLQHMYSDFNAPPGAHITYRLGYTAAITFACMGPRSGENNSARIAIRGRAPGGGDAPATTPTRLMLPQEAADADNRNPVSRTSSPGRKFHVTACRSLRGSPSGGCENKTALRGSKAAGAARTRTWKCRGARL